VGGETLHVVDVGEGSPTVVFEAGAGATLESWTAVVPKVAAEARVIAYDRPGFGFSSSDERSVDRRPLAAATRLGRLLDHLGVPGPYVLVGHSLGGLHVRAFASLRPDQTAGLVLVDPSHEDMLAVLRSEGWRGRLAGSVQRLTLGALGVLAPLGTPTLLAPLLVPKSAARKLGVSPPELRVVRARHARAAHVRGFIDEFRQLDASLEQVSRLHVPTSIPTTVLSGDRLGRGRRREEQRTAVNKLHAELAARSPGGEHIVVRECGHLVPVDQPAAVVDAVIRMITAWRGERPEVP
jgi:pimeloyl-ACP methyl ester carboxylesterase